MIVCALRIELYLPTVHSLKEKRAVIRPIIDGARHRHHVAAAETGHHDRWQRAEIGMAVVGGSTAHVREVAYAVERFVWSFPEAEVISIERAWLDPDDE
jgi:uncharacterized protein YlxP (DUF503 family)